MKTNTLCLLFLALFLSVGIHTTAQSLYVRESNGTQTSFELNDIKKLDFSFGNFSVYISTGNSVYTMADLAYLSFQEYVATSVPSDLKSLEWNVYPNPASNMLFIQLPNGSETDHLVKIYRMSGMLEIERYIVSDHEMLSIDIQSLTPGMYLLLLNNNSGRYVKSIVKY